MAESSSASAAGRRGVTRRAVLGAVAVALVALGALAWARRTPLRRWLLAETTGAEPPGRLGDATLATLEAATAALLGGGIEPTHYRDLFRWRAEHLAGARALYERFARRLDRGARGLGQRSFRTASPEAQRRVLAAFRPAAGALRIRRALLARDDERCARLVVREILRLFARTDAWVRSGYPSWPGMPRAVASLARAPERP